MTRISQDEIINWWLGRYFDTNIKYIVENRADLVSDSCLFFAEFAVTQEQHDEWYEWFIEYLSKKLKCSKKQCKANGMIAYLKTAPQIKNIE